MPKRLLTWLTRGWPPLNSEKRFWVAHPCGLVSCKGGVFLLSFFQFLFSIFWQLRAEFSNCKALESAEALGQFDSGQAVLAIEPAKEVRRGMRALPGGWPPLNSENVFGWPILAGLFHARAGGAPFGI